MTETITITNDIEQTFGELLAAWKAENFEKAGPLLIHIVERLPLSALEAILLTNIDAAMSLFELFVKTGLDEAADGTPARDFYLKLVDYIMLNQTPEIRQAMRKAFRHCFPELSPVGFDEDGRPLYNMDDVAEALETDPDHLMLEAEKLGIQPIAIQGPGEGETVH